MTEIQRVVDELRFMLMQEVIDQTDELAALVRAYSDRCRAANLRLRKCDECLKQGLRSEALHLAEATPNLLDVVAVLDFAERPRLIEVVTMYFFTPPEPLLLEVAAAVNEAYALQGPLQQLLESHRLMVLGRGSLSQRLPVLRSLAKLDPASVHWEADVREMERARLGEMESEVRTAAARSDMPALQALLEETQAEGWCEEIPATLLKSIKGRLTQTQRVHARGRMEELETLLHAAFNARDVAQARVLRDEWKRELQAVPLPPGDPLRERVAPILNWLDDEDRTLKIEQAYAKSVADIDRAVSNHALSLADLKKLGLDFDRQQSGLPREHQRSLPEDLEGRYLQRLASQAAKEAGRRQMLMAASVAGIVLALSAIGVVVYVSNEAGKERRIIAAVAAYLADGKLSEARQLLAQRSAGSTSESWLATVKRVNDADSADRDRVTQFQAELDKAAQSNEPVIIEAALKRAHELARSADEKIVVDKQQATWQQRVTHETAAREQQFRESLASASQSLQSLDSALRGTDPVEPDRLSELLSEAGTRVSKLSASNGTIAKELEEQAAALKRRLEAARQGVANVARKHDLLDRLTHAALLLPGTGQGTSKAGAFEATLREFATALPEDARASVMKSAAETCPLPSVLAYQKLVSRWKNLRPANEKEDLETRVREVRNFLTEHGTSPHRELIERYQTWLAAIQRRTADEGDPDEGLKSRLTKLFSSKFVKDVHILRDTEGRVYYLPEVRTEPFGSVVSFKYLVDFNGTARQVKDLKLTDIPSFKSTPPPQHEIAAKFRTTIKEIGLDNWQRHLREMTETLLKANQVDPFLRYRLVAQTLELAAGGDHLLGQELADVIQDLDDDDLDKTVTWMDPLNKKGDEARKRALELLAKVPPLEPIFAKAFKRQEQFEREMFTPRFSIGWLEKSHRGVWSCRTKWTTTGQHVLHVVSRVDSTRGRNWQELGRVSGNALTIDSSVAEEVGEAAVVFASSASGSSSE